MPESALQVAAALTDAGADQEQVALAYSADELAAHNDRGRWLIAPGQGASWIVGGVERGAMVVYDQYDDLALAAGALRHLTTTTTPVLRLDEAQSDAARLAARDLADRILHAVRANAGRPARIDLVPGDVIDRFGHESGAATFVLGTLVPDRSLSPSEVTQPYRTYRVRTAVDGGVVAGPVAPWFGQPGGGLKLVLPRAARWCCDAGLLDEVLLESRD